MKICPFRASFIAEECRTAYESSDSEALRLLPELFRLSEVKSDQNVSKIGKAEAERRSAQSRYDKNVLHKTLSELIKRIGKPAQAALLDTLSSDSHMVRATAISAMRSAEVFSQEITDYCFNNWKKLIVRDSFSEHDHREIIDEIGSINLDIETPRESTIAKAFKFYRWISGEQTEEDIREVEVEQKHLAIEERRALARYLEKTPHLLNEKFETILSLSSTLLLEEELTGEPEIEITNILKATVKEDKSKISLLIKALRVENDNIKYIALNVLQACNKEISDQEIAEIIPHLKSKTTIIRNESIELLGRLKTRAKKYGFLLLDIAQEEEHGGAIYALGKIKEPREEIIHYLASRWHEYKHLESNPEITIGNEGDAPKHLSRESLSYINMHMPKRNISESNEEHLSPSVKIIPTLSTLGHFLADERVKKIYDEAILMRSPVVRMALIQGLKNAANFSRVEHYLNKALRTQAEPRNIIDIAARYGEKGFNLIDQYRDELTVLMNSETDSNSQLRYKNHLREVEKYITLNKALSEHHRENNIKFYITEDLS